MSGIESIKQKKVQEILFLVKLASLLFAVIAYFRFFVKELSHDNQIQFFNSLNTATVLLILTVTYLLWSFIEQKSKEANNLFYRFAQPGIFILFYSGAIFFTGLYESHFKFLFIFLIVSYTIERGLKGGLIIAGVSSALIFGMDLLLVPDNGVNYYFEDDISLIGLFFIIATTVGYYVNLERGHIRHLNTLVNQDTLTGLFNHRYFHECLNNALKSAKTHRRPLSLLMCDMDYFKQFNDIHGHQGGDELLHDVAKFFIDHLSKQHPVFRYGGDEFAVLLPNVSPEEAKSIANDLREKFAAKIFKGEEYLPNENFTMSIGISTYDPAQKTTPKLLRDADVALYKAKIFRKNRVEAYVSILDELNLHEKAGIDSESMVTSIKTLISVINSRDKFTYTHLQRVVAYCKLFAEDLGLNEEDKKQLCYAAYIHDIGKIDVPKEIVAKTGDLTREEWEILKTHPAIGAEMIKNVESLGTVYDIILQHHERYDGEGYPSGIKGTAINYLARVLTVVDAFDAMTSERPYQAKKTYIEGIKELNRCRGEQFDPDIVDK
ncbi:MAG: bifunctional diguanylate cyclase/phosphohydrolase, partial [Saccharofermentanales bacterium]